MTLQELLNSAWETKKEGDLLKALNLYNQAFDIIIKEASEYAHNSGDTIIDEGKTRKILPSHFTKVQEYLRKDKVAAVISNNMGTIFAQLDDFKSAEEFFHQAIELTPDNENFQDPHIGLREIQRYKNL